MFEQDQAAGLRQLFAQANVSQPSTARAQPQVIAIAGAPFVKGAVVHDLAIKYATKNQSVIVIDGSAGEFAAKFGLCSRYELAHLIAGDKRLDDILLKASSRLRILPAARGLSRIDEFDATEMQRLSQAFQQLPALPEVFIIYTHALETARVVNGFGKHIQVFIAVADDRDSLTAAYREIKALKMSHDLRHFEIILGLTDAPEQAERVYENLAQTAAQFLEVNLNLHCVIPLDDPSPYPLQMSTRLTFGQAVMAAAQPEVFRAVRH